MKMNILTKRHDQVARILKQQFGKGDFHADALYREVFKLGNQNPFGAMEFRSSPKITQQLEPELEIKPGKVINVLKDGDLTKFITRLSDGLKIESVIIPMTRYQTLCVSSQVGCKMGCRFCQTAQMGFQRDLTVEEIVGQVYNARFTLNADIKNIVFMGMGEPLDNFNPLLQAIKIMNEQKGFDIALRHMTLSTCGIVKGIQRLAELNLPSIRLAVSINSADDKIRSSIMPVNRTNPLATLKETLRSFPLTKRGCFLFEYILIKGLNDSKEDAMKLAEYINPLPVRLNLIPYNTVPGFDFESPEDKQMHGFADILTSEGVFVIKRWSKGQSVSAGCGQLGYSQAR